MKLTNIENKLIGHWVVENGSVVKDDVTKRIELLIKDYLRKIATDASGWDVLYIDPIDKRLWERVYLESELHGGGPPSLINISETDAKIKYSNVAW